MEEKNGLAPENTENTAAEEDTATAEKNGKKSKGRKDVKTEIIEWVKDIAVALIAVMLIRTFVFQLVRVDGKSMLETLQNNDILFVTVFDRFFPDNWERGDVVICNYPNADGYRVKRIVGLPGDTVSVKDGVTYVNGEALEEDFVDYPAISDYEEITVPEGYYFLMGDNRAISKDSRHSSVGPIEQSEIRGKVRCVVFPFSDIRTVE